MRRLRQTFQLMENFGVLRQVARYVRHETGLGEVAFYEQVIADATADAERWPHLHMAQQLVVNLMVPPVSWRFFYDELADYLVEVIGVTRDDALQTVIDVQHALVPDRGRSFPVVLDLPHDYGAWHGQLMAVKDSGHRSDWSSMVEPLRNQPPGRLTIDDSRRAADLAPGHPAEFYGFGYSWELDSPLSRPTMFGEQWVAALADA